MLKVQEHQELLSAQYLIGCLEEEHNCHNITKVDPLLKQKQGGTSHQASAFCLTLQDATSKKIPLDQVHTALSKRTISNLTKNKCAMTIPLRLKSLRSVQISISEPKKYPRSSKELISIVKKFWAC